MSFEYANDTLLQKSFSNDCSMSCLPFTIKISFFFSFGLTVWHMGSKFLDRIKPTSPPALEAQRLNHWTTRKFFNFIF